MEQAGQGKAGVPEGGRSVPSGAGAATRTGQSGEGARSALEQLVQQEKKRDAQRLREAGAPPAAPGS
jgi:hypothetical protein